MARLLIPILIVALAPAVVIPLGLSKGLQWRQLVNYNRLADGAGRFRLLALINRNKLRRLFARSKQKAVLIWSRLLRLANRVKSLILTRPAEIEELIGRLRFPRAFSRVAFSKMMGHFSLLSRAAWSKLHELMDRNELTGPVICQNVSRLVGRIKSSLLRKAAPGRTIVSSAEPDLSVLNCRVQPAKSQKDDSIRDVFTVEICGSISAPSDMHYATLRVSIEDVTDGPHKTVPLQARTKQWQMQDSPAFCYSADLGKLPNQVTTLSVWTMVAQLNLEWLMFPRKGKRYLQFTASVLSQQTGKELDTAQYTLSYENPAPGYIDLRENVQRTRTLAVALALAVSAADQKLYGCEVELIKNWAKSNIGVSKLIPDKPHLAKPPKVPRASDRASYKLDKAFEQAVRFFRDGNQVDTYKICKEIVEIAPVVDRYDILDLCLDVAGANSSVVAEELAILKNLADWLEVDADRFRAMMEKTLPVSMHQVKDAEVTLGVTSDMSERETIQQLNKEYCKWNSRVTSSDPQVQAQADQMLKLIAEARAEYIA